MKDRRKLYVALFLIILIVYLGFIRDTFFVTINNIIDQLYYNTELIYNHKFYDFLASLGVGGLLKLKWLLTFVFMFLNYVLSFLIIRNLFGNNTRLILLLKGGYVLLLFISALLYLGGKLIGEYELGYTLARRFMGVLQSPVPLMVIVAVHMLFANVKVSRI